MKKIKTIIVLIVYTLLCVLTVIIDWSKWRIPDYIPVLAKAWMALFMVIPIIMIFGGLICGIVYLWKKRKASWIFISILCAIVAVTVLLHTVIPLTDAYININFNLNIEKMEYIVGIIEDKQLRKITVGKYWLPDELRYVSHTGMVYNDIGSNFMHPKDDESKKVLFYVHCGAWKSSAIIYVADDSEIADGDFGRTFDKIYKLKDHWYGVVME